MSSTQTRAIVSRRWNSSLTFALFGVDVGFENPTFAAIELDYSEADMDPTEQALAEATITLAYYELHLGLNHAVRMWIEGIPYTAHLLIPVPGGSEGPSGACALKTLGCILTTHQSGSIFQVYQMSMV
jgi:splicing factor 3B subunit 3